MNICVITDNEYLYKRFCEIVHEKCLEHKFKFFFSTINKDFKEKYRDDENFEAIKLNEQNEEFFCKFDLFISLHSKQIFPRELVTRYRCINIHPGFNPFNRGWFPQVFSIINKLPIGVTIHEMDTELDHGPIIMQKEVPIYDFDTAYDVYNRIQKLEIELLRDNLEKLISNDYDKHMPESEGNINYKTDFESLCRIDLNQMGTFGEFLDILRATTFKDYDNAYFIDNQGRKVFVSVNLWKEECQSERL